MVQITGDLQARGHFRNLLPWEHQRYAAHLIRLSPEDRRRRFLGTPADSFLRLHARGVLASARSVAIGWFLDGELHGAAELAFSGFRSGGPAEAAFSVEAIHRRNGIGSELMSRALRCARNRRATTLIVLTEPANIPMMRLARKFGGSFTLGTGFAEGDIPVPNATPISVLDELHEQERGLFANLVFGWIDRTRGALNSVRYRFTN